MKTTISLFLLYILNQFSIAASAPLDAKDIDKNSKLYPEIAHCEIINYQEQYVSNGKIITKKQAEEANSALYDINPEGDDYKRERKKFFKTEQGKLVAGMEPILHILTLKVNKKLYGNKETPTIIRCVWEESHNPNCPHVAIELKKGKKIHIYSKTNLHSLMMAFQLGNAKTEE